MEQRWASDTGTFSLKEMLEIKKTSYLRVAVWFAQMFKKKKKNLIILN